MSQGNRKPKKKSQCAEFPELAANVLGYWDESEGKWVALALEMDLRGYGATFEKAAEELLDLIAMQISFALFKKQPEMIMKPADPTWFELFAQLRSERLTSFAEKETDPNYEIRSVPVPRPRMNDNFADQFQFMNA